MDFPGYGIGGLAVGEAKHLTWSMLETVTEILPANKPRYLMGVGAPEDLLDGVARGVDMFDCVLPTRIARNGALFTRAGRLNIRNTANTRDARPIEDGCECYTCQHFSRAYLRHLFKAEEILGLRLDDHSQPALPAQPHAPGPPIDPGRRLPGVPAGVHGLGTASPTRRSRPRTRRAGSPAPGSAQSTCAWEDTSRQPGQVQHSGKSSLP